MERASYFPETAIGAVVLVAIQFLSLPILVGGLALVGLATLVSRRMRRRTAPD
jgi:MYXO-CTERM domain-containing protein